jgi:tetratricopeptide (TPR) repeat protein
LDNVRIGTLRAFTLSLLLTIGSVAGAQDEPKAADTKPASDVERMVREGMPETLESRFSGGRTAEEFQLLAHAYINKARKARSAADRQRALDRANEKFARWIALAEKASGSDPDKAAVGLAVARVAYAGALLTQEAGPELDESELTNGQRGDRGKLLKQLTTARELYEKAVEGLKPIVDDLTRKEEELLTKGSFETLQQTWLDAVFNLGWVNLYLANLESRDEQKKRDACKAAEKRFQEIIDRGQTGQTLFQCYLGLGMAQRAQDRFPEAERSFAKAMDSGVERSIEAQARYELARCHIQSGKFDEARAALKPLIDKDAPTLAAEDRPARFYINLALIWDAYSHLLEADAVRKEAAGSTATTAILQKAQRSRESGLAKLNRLAARGGAWPGLVQLYVASAVDMKADLKSLGPVELYFTGGQLYDAKKYRDAIARLQEAASRADLDPDLAGRILFDLGKAQYALDDSRAAATTFQTLAGKHRSHPQAPQAATNAFQLWAKVAERSKAKEDYDRLAQTLLNLLQTFPDHKEREDALWWLPLSLQLAGRYAEAQEHFANIPESSPKREEAEFRKAVCGRFACEAERTALAPDAYAQKAGAAAAALLKYADQALERSGNTADPAAGKKWSAEARVHAGELLTAAGVERFQAALDALGSFEQRYPESDAIGRVLAVRIRAYRGLKQFDQASAILQQYLQTVPPEQAGGTLGVLARGMQEEVERLTAAGQQDAARQLAQESLATFEELEKWVRDDPKRAKYVEVVVFGRAQMMYLAGKFDAAQDAVRGLLSAAPKNGNYQHLLAQIVTARLTDDASAAELQSAQQAWAALLTDPAIRTRAPDRYWEARFHWLTILLRQGAAADVEKAITQERVWYPDLGGQPWKQRLDDLLRAAREKQGLPAETTPAETQPAGESE